MVALLAAAVVACTSAALTLPATTMTGDGVENNLTEGTTTALAVDPNAASSETAAHSSTPESVAPAVEESAPQSAPETTEESEPAESETVSDPAAQTEETAALPQGAEVPADCTQPYTFHDDENGFTVTVWAPEGAFNEEVTLKAKLLDETDSAYAEAKQELDEKAAEEPALLSEDGETPDYGFAALDIHFENAAGEEIEPANEVYVAIDADKLLPEDADPDSVMVQHHAEQDNGDVTVETVADTADETDGKIETTAASDDTANVQAAFEVQSFSMFTITWQNGKDVTKVTVNCYYYDENGNPQPIENGKVPNLDKTLGDGGSITFTSDNPDLKIDGYTFNNAKYSFDSGRLQDLTSIEIGREGFLEHWYVSFNGGKHQNKNNKSITINLYYNIDNGGGGQGGNPGGGTVTQEATVTTGKTAVLRDDGNYDLTLTVSGDRGTSTNKQQVDVLFILDESNSMGEQWGYQKRITAAKNAIGQITGYGDNNGLSDNKNLDVQYALVGFGGGDSTEGYRIPIIGIWVPGNGPYKDAGTDQSWTSNPDTIYNAVPNIDNGTNRYGGGTNYEAGFRTGKEVLAGARDDAMKVVIFISDGGPGYYYDDEGYTDGDGNPSNYNSTALQHGVDEVKTLTGMNNFYFVGVTGDVTSKVYKDITDAAPVAQANKQAISASDPDDLLEAFKDIQSDISHFSAKDVTITDPLSQYAEIVPGENNQVMFTVKLEKQNKQGGYDQVGEAQTVASGSPATFTTQAPGDDGKLEDTNFTITPSFANGTITAVLAGQNNKSYELAPGYRYSISTVITPSQAAITAGANSYNGTGEANTGTYAGKQGFWSNDNDNAKVTYTANGEEGSKNFPKPVIQVQKTETPVSIAFEKVNDDGNPLGGAVFNLYYQRAVEGGAPVNVYYVDITTTAENGTTTTSNGWCTEDKITQNPNVKIVKHEFTSSSDSDSLGNFTVSFTTDEENTSNEYYLQEVKAPDGYQLPVHDFRIALQGQNWVAYEYVKPVSGDTSGAPWKELAKDETEKIYKISNSTGVELPATGSIGTTPFATIGGPLFAVCAVGLGFGLRRRRGKEAK